MKTLLLTTTALLANIAVSTCAHAWTDNYGHWQEGPAYGVYPHPDYNPPPYYGHPLPPPYAYGPPPPAYYGPPPVYYGPPGISFGIGPRGFHFNIGGIGL